MFRGFRVDRRLLATVAALAVVTTTRAQEPLTTREVDVTLTEGTSMAAAASPDRRWIAIDLLGALWVLPFRGGEARKITPDLLEARQPSWSPDSDSIAFQGYGDDGAWHIYVISRDGGDARALTSGEFDDREPAWSRDGNRIAFSSDRFGGITTIWTVGAQAHDVAQFSERDCWMPSWAPGDQEINCVSADIRQPMNNRHAGLWAIGGGRERLILDATAAKVEMPAAASWNPDGAILAYTTNGRLFVDGRPVSGADEDVFPFRPQWISEGEFLYTADGHIERRSVAGATSVINFTATVPLKRDTYTIAHRQTLEPTEPQPLTGIVNPVVSPDGRAIAFTALGDLWVYPIGGTPVRLTNDSAVELDPAWSPDGSRLAYSSDRSGHMNLWVRDFRTNQETPLVEERGAASGAVWSPDGNHIAYLVDRRTPMVLTVQRDSHRGVVPTVPTASGELGRPTWNADNKAIILGSLFPYSNRYREGLNQTLLLTLDPSAAFSSILFPGHSAGNRQDTGPVWSPDGFHMAFTTEGALWNVPVDFKGTPTGPPQQIADGNPESPSWEGDSRHIVYQTPRGLFRVPADGGQPERIPLDLQWQPSVPPERVIVHAGHVFDGTTDGLRAETDIVIEHGVIRELTDHNPDLHVGAVVDASSETVIPGLIEMHAHLDRDYGENFGRAWLAYGITSVRIPAINPFEALELREAIANGRRAGPRTFTAGDPFDGARAYYPGGTTLSSEGQIESEIDRASTLGMDFLKTYVRLPDRLQKSVVEHAHARGLPVTSHELYPAVAFGIDGVEHLRGTSRRGYSPKLSATNRAYRDVVDLIAKSGITLTPTIGIQGGFEARASGDKTLLFDPRLSLYPLPLVSTLTDYATRTPTMQRDAERDAALKPYEATIKAVAAAGGKIIAGTDSPIIPYGLGLQLEIESYVHAGLTPFQALQTATINAARALGRDDEIGTVERGKVADLTFLGGDPLSDIKNLRDVRRVMRGGRIYMVSDLIRR
ncbi:MAG: amidohydrolase family protein [Acidobacteriia bacterium]|nr:amidohydrolase family protein [Terriglobia bacterium]